MSRLNHMPSIMIPPGALLPFGKTWQKNNCRLSRTPPQSSSQLGNIFDEEVGSALAVLLGGIPVVKPHSRSLTAAETDCVEVRPQNFDVGYRPDGIRFAFDSKTLNDTDSLRKNWQNMVNDLATEATTVHSRFPHAVVGFMVIIPAPCFIEPQKSAMIETLERLARRTNVGDSDYMAEAISLVIWDPKTGNIDPNVPQTDSPLRLEKFSTFIEVAYVNRYKGLPPHATAE
jgi:hypothetical protein